MPGLRQHPFLQLVQLYPQQHVKCAWQHIEPEVAAMAGNGTVRKFAACQIV
jgi:hypothetical protein